MNHDERLSTYNTFNGKWRMYMYALSKIGQFQFSFYCCLNTNTCYLIRVRTIEFDICIVRSTKSAQRFIVCCCNIISSLVLMWPIIFGVALLLVLGQISCPHASEVIWIWVNQTVINHNKSRESKNCMQISWDELFQLNPVVARLMFKSKVL